MAIAGRLKHHYGYELWDATGTKLLAATRVQQSPEFASAMWAVTDEDGDMISTHGTKKEAIEAAYAYLIVQEQKTI